MRVSDGNITLLQNTLVYTLVLRLLLTLHISILMGEMLQTSKVTISDIVHAFTLKYRTPELDLIRTKPFNTPYGDMFWYLEILQ